MVLTPEQLSRYAFGFRQLKIRENDGAQFVRFDDEQLAYYEPNQIYFDRCMSSSGVSLEFDTNTTSLSFSYEIERICSFDTIDLLVNGVLMKSQRYSFEDHAGTFTMEFPKGGKRVKIILPLYAATVIRNFTVDDGCNLVTVKNKGTKVLALGDSITQGNGAQTSCCSYIWTLSRLLGWNVLNQAIGGYVHEAKGLFPIDYQPEIITVAFGANDYQSSHFAERAGEFYTRLAEIYPGVKTYAITPLWMKNAKESLWDVHDCIKKITAPYPNITLIKGMDLVPHMEEFFMDGVHPARHGHLMYGSGAAARILQEK